ncbi:NAD(+) kinase [Acinetobacter baumannii]|uniref:NAD(+) kinase n=1 Tax=Acinetobacter baumannii TaxID=470 RepID=UPI001BD109BE|nr:NAD(+) kinase [Acinetobacter baumannii]MBS4734745.1 NAD(+) kinase [Acinetobacter baumannii]MCH1772466.1 NAD(+) kinase [Acinetobacter baumannii]MCR0003814.1 NAD(+) kinase [Acinetobacter baumannii]
MQISHKSFRNVGLIGRPDKSSVVEILCLIHDHLLSLGLNPIFDQETAELVPYDHAQVVSRHLLGEVADLVIVVGGDGSLLHAARALVRYNTPVIGINRGRLGFLTDIKPSEAIFKLDQVLQGHFQLDRRFLLEMEVRTNGEVIYDAIALNDVVLHSGKSVHMIDFELNIDGQYVYRQHSDGLIVSTPTGSTAYALSGGGPILHPSMDAIALVPMHPHTLSSRPIVVGGQSEIKIVIRENRVLPMVSADGQHSVSLNVGDSLHIRKHPFKLSLLHPPGYDFYMACRTKLGWNQDFESFQRDES